MYIKNLAALYQFLDELVVGENSISEYDIEDVLFASSYVRGFISLAACQYGGDEQLLTQALLIDITDKIHAARRELSPADQVIVNSFWQQLQATFSA